MITRARANILHSGQIVVAQLAMVAVLLATLARAPLAWLAAVPIAVGLALLAFGRWRERWVAGWLALGLRYLLRHRTLAPGADPATLLAFVAPGTAIWPTRRPETESPAAAGPSGAARSGGDTGIGRDYGSPGNPPDSGGAGRNVAAVLADPDGLTAVLALGDDFPLAGAGLVLPGPVELLPPGPPVTVQLLIASVPPTGAGPAATCYRRLTGTPVPARQRALLAVRAQPAGPDLDIHQVLDSAVRRIGRRLRDEHLAYRRLDSTELLATVAELAHHQLRQPAREGWAGLVLGGLGQLCLRVTGLDRLAPERIGELLPRLLGSAQAATTLALTTTGAGLDLVIRLAAPTPAGLAEAAPAAARILAAVGLGAERLDGAHLAGLAGTLPLGRSQTSPGQTTPTPQSTEMSTQHHTGRQSERRTERPGWATEPRVDRPGYRIGLPAAGLMLGRDRRGEPVTVRVFGPRPGRLMLVGGVAAGQLLALRALAVGARLTVCTDRPAVWQRFLGAVSRPGEPIGLVPAAGPVALPTAGPLSPQLLVVDGPAATTAAEAPWRSTLLLRELLTPADLEPLARAELAILQPLAPAQAALAGTALGLGSGREWLSRIRADMVCAAGRRPDGRHTVRWALLCATELEGQLIDAPQRVAAG